MDGGDEWDGLGRVWGEGGGGRGGGVIYGGGADGYV